MGSPKHLWSGDWEEEAAAAAAERRRGRAPLSEPVQGLASPPPRSAQRATPRAARERRRVRVAISRDEARRWAVAAGIALLAAFCTASVITLIARADAQRPNAAAGTRAGARGPGAPGPTRTPPRPGGWLGAEIQSSPAGGVMIVAVFQGSPADTGGLMPGDVISALDSTVLAGPADLSAALARVRPGQVARVRGRRGQASFTAQVRLVSRPRGYPVP